MPLYKHSVYEKAVVIAVLHLQRTVLAIYSMTVLYALVLSMSLFIDLLKNLIVEILWDLQ
jgi:hypothetical protein